MSTRRRTETRLLLGIVLILFAATIVAGCIVRQSFATSADQIRHNWADQP